MLEMCGREVCLGGGRNEHSDGESARRDGMDLNHECDHAARFLCRESLRVRLWRRYSRIVKNDGGTLARRRRVGRSV